MTDTIISFPAPQPIVLQVEGIQGPPGGGGGTIDDGSVTLAKLADIATDSFLGRDTAGTGVPEVLTPAQARGILNVADGATANASDAALRDRASHTGSQLAASISDLAAAVALVPEVVANSAKVTNATHTGDVTGDTALTIAAFAVTSGKIADDAVGNDKLANMAVGTIKARVTAGSGNPENATGAEVTALLDTFTSGAKGLVPASGGGTANFLRADGTFADPPETSPGGATGEVQYNNAGAFAGAADVEIEAGQLRLPTIATPAAPAADGVKLFGKSVGGRAMPAFMGPAGLEWALQSYMGHGRVAFAKPPGNGNTAPQVMGCLITGTGTATGANFAPAARHTRMARFEYLVTVAAVTAVAGWRTTAAQWTVGAATDGDGGFFVSMTWAPATGVATATTRAFCGMRPPNAPTDVEPSSIANICGMGWDAADTNVQFLHNDASGAATKIDLGASFPVPTVDRTSAYRIDMYAPPGTTQSVSYVITDLVSGAVATGTVTTDLPANTVALGPHNYMSVGGTSSVIGVAMMNCHIESDY